jgi:ATP-dependent Zn protease
MLKTLKSYISLNEILAIEIYFVSGDRFFNTLLIKKISIGEPSKIKEFSNFDSFIEELTLHEGKIPNMHYIIMDSELGNNHLPPISIEECIKKIFELKIEKQIIILDSSIQSQKKVNLSNLVYIPKNDNSYKRIEQIIFTTHNDFQIITRKKANKIIFINTAIIIFIIITFLIFYIFTYL